MCRKGKSRGGEKIKKREQKRIENKEDRKLGEGRKGGKRKGKGGKGKREIGKGENKGKRVKRFNFWAWSISIAKECCAADRQEDFDTH